MIIAVKNHSEIPEDDVFAAVRAINRQIAEDFEPYWDLGATLRLADRKARKPTADAIIRIYPHGHDYHWSPTGLPEAHVFTDLSTLAKESVPWLTWAHELSHEALELIADPQLNTLVRGPHPTRPKRIVFHYREICDPVQSESYLIDGITVSNFVLPHYYNSMGESGGRNDFLGNGLPGISLERERHHRLLGSPPGRARELRHLAPVRPEPPGRQAPSHEGVDRPPLPIRPPEGPWKYSIG